MCTFAHDPGSPRALKPHIMCSLKCIADRSLYPPSLAPPPALTSARRSQVNNATARIQTKKPSSSAAALPNGESECDVTVTSRTADDVTEDGLRRCAMAVSESGGSAAAVPSLSVTVKCGRQMPRLWLFLLALPLNQLADTITS